MLDANNVRTYLAQGKPLLFDGAMGTWYAAQLGRVSLQCERANLDDPGQVLTIHRAYLAAGCQAIKTNTFSLSADFAHGNAAMGTRLIEAGCRLAKEAAMGTSAFVFADLGPAPQDAADPAAVYLAQADVFLGQGITCFLAETLLSDEGIPELARHLKARCPDAFLIVSYAVGADGVTHGGRLGRKLFQRTAALPEVDAVGFNCMSGPHHLLEVIQDLDIGSTVFSVMPNAGYPTVLGRRTVYDGKPDYFARQLARFVRGGAAIVGGCCGTTPAHIAAMAGVLSVLEDVAPPVQQVPIQQAASVQQTASVQQVKSVENSLWDKLEAGGRVVAVELDPPMDDDIDGFVDGVRVLRDAGADVVTIADCPVGRPRADSSLLACKLKRELGMEPLPHMACRDRNLNATKALLLGLSMEGVHNVLLVTGDPIPTADRDEVKSVFNFNSRKLARYVSDLNETTLRAPFRIFGALNLNAQNFEVQLRTAREKEANGVSGFLTQPVLSREALENLELAREALSGKILGGVFPVVSHRNACFLNNEISGMRVCDEIVDLYEGKGREESEDLAVRISAAVAREITPYTDGIYLMTPFRRVELMARILAEIK